MHVTYTSVVWNALFLTRTYFNLDLKLLTVDREGFFLKTFVESAERRSIVCVLQDRLQNHHAFLYFFLSLKIQEHERMNRLKMNTQGPKTYKEFKKIFQFLFLGVEKGRILRLGEND